MPIKNVITALRAFLRSCSGKSQSEILKLFLFTLIEQNTVSESGSIVIYNPATDKLNLFNDDDFLFKRGFLKRGEHWQQLVERARQNVIFESGYLLVQFRDARRVCFLVQRPVEMPSDLKGLLYEEFETIDRSRGRILSVLEEWQLISPTRG